MSLAAARPERSLIVLVVLALAGGCAGEVRSPDGAGGDGGARIDVADSALPVDSALPADGAAALDVVPSTDGAMGQDAVEPPPADAQPPADAKPPPAGACPELVPLRDKAVDSSAALQLCIDRTSPGGTLELPAGRYHLADQVKLTQPLTLRTAGSAGAPPCGVSGACAELVALPALTANFGLLRVEGSGLHVDHLVLDGNRQGRAGTAAHAACVAGNNAPGHNGIFSCSSCSLTNSSSNNALCGTGLVVTGSATNVTIADSTFANNGRHDQQNLWSDGLTVHDAKQSTFVNNVFVDNTDVDLIFGGCQQCVIQNNTITHTADPAAGAFAALMIQKWPSTSGNYQDVDVSGNKVDCGPLRACGSGLYIGSESWYPETPYGTLTPGTTSGSIHHNSVVNAMNGLYIAAIGLTIYQNSVLNAHGVPIPNSCHKSIVSATPYVVSPTAKSIHFMGENVDPAMKIHFSNADWSGCIPNYPF